MKKYIKMFICVLCVMLGCSAVVTESVQAGTSGKWYDLGQNWRFRVDPPHTENSNAKWHVHVENTKTGVKGSEGVDGTKSHGDNMNKIPDKIKKKVKAHDEYKKGKEKQKKLKKAVKEIKKEKLKIDWEHIADVIVAIGIVITCTATVFFAGDDIAAWMNLFRALGC